MDTLENVTKLAETLSPIEQLRLVEHLARRLQITAPAQKKPQSLRGIWKGKFPEDVDIEKAIREIRDEWKKELDEL